MGMFFAERLYRYKLPDLVNSHTTTWVVAEKNNKVVGFGSFEQTNRGIEIREIYTIQKNHQLWQGIASKISIILKKQNSKLIYTTLPKVEKKQLNYFIEKGFFIKRENKNSCYLEKANLMIM